ncbi:MAG: Rrf2 family transcriptional regulator [Mogibacterium sp.]|nr:Rrf2 family transcriptional regulator [Mogibacterium sp.]
MQITSRFTIAVHIITAIDYFREAERVNSEFLAGSAGVNPVIVRTVIGMLREAGILETKRGSRGAELKKPLDQITFYDIYQAVDSVNETEGLFHFHEQPSPECPVGRNIHKAMDSKLRAVQDAMEEEMRRITLADVVRDTRREIRKEEL